jgi:hypothetical protein
MGEWRNVITREEGESAVNDIIENQTYNAVLLVWSDPPPDSLFLEKAKSRSLIHPWRAGIHIAIPEEEDIPDKLRKEHYNVSDAQCAVTLTSTRSVCCFLHPGEAHKIEACFLQAEST